MEIKQVEFGDNQAAQDELNLDNKFDAIHTSSVHTISMALKALRRVTQSKHNKPKDAAKV